MLYFARNLAIYACKLCALRVEDSHATSDANQRPPQLLLVLLITLPVAVDLSPRQYARFRLGARAPRAQSCLRQKHRARRSSYAAFRLEDDASASSSRLTLQDPPR